MKSSAKHNHSNCKSLALKKAEDICTQKGTKLTKVRKTVLELIWQNHQGRKAYDLLEELKKQDAGAKPPTIYRALDFLVQNGLIHKIESTNSFVGCSHAELGKNCQLFICNSCGNVSELVSDVIVQEIMQGAKKQKFKVSSYTTEAKGLCSACV